MPSQDTVVSVIRGNGVALVIVGDAREWDRVWNSREEFDSDATLWLRTLEQKPSLAEESLVWPEFGNRCRSYARGVVAQLQKDGVDVLSLRRHDSYNSGPKARRPVFTPHGWFKSVRACARSIGISHTVLLERLNDPLRPEYRFDEVKK